MYLLVGAARRSLRRKIRATISWLLRQPIMRANLVLFVFAACASSPAQLNITKTIGSEGGTAGSGDTSVQVPAGALTSPSMITITGVNAPPPANAAVVGPAFDFGPSGQTFTTPVTLTLPFDPTLIPSGKSAADILVYTAPLGSSEYTTLRPTVSGNTVQVKTTHFTVYLPAVPTAPAALDFGVPQSSPDLACGSPDCHLTSGGCSCSQSCNGHTFVMNCGGTTTASCSCSVDGTIKSAFDTSCAQQSTYESVFFSMCGAS
jgi:hypothetical protein